MEDDFLTKSLHGIVKAGRLQRLNNSDQLTLGELMLKLEALLPNQEAIAKKYGQEANVVFDFEYAIPTGLGSWRGSYDELAINFNFRGYEYFGGKKPEEMSLSKFIKILKDTLGKEFTGWKGGEFVMGKTTPLWVANDGNSGNTAVIDVLDNEYEVVLVTGRREY
jgi:hypothetical protein